MMGRTAVSMISLCAAVCLAAACGSSPAGPAGGGTTNNDLTVGGQTYSLLTLYFDYYGMNGVGAYNTDVYILSDSSATGTVFDYVYLEMFFADSAVSGGTYVYTDDDYDSAPASTFTGISFIEIGYDTQTGYSEEFYQITDGEVTISISGSAYTITGDVEVENDETATFSYTGTLTGNL